MNKKDYGECVGKCAVCTINLWSSSGGKPVIWPCNMLNCPYEDPKSQNRHIGQQLLSSTGSGLGQIDY